MRQSRTRMTRPWESPAYEPPPSFYRLPMTRTRERLKAILIAAGAAHFGEGPAKGLLWPLMAEAFLGCLLARALARLLTWRQCPIWKSRDRAPARPTARIRPQ
jgi:hypothetical protein